MRLQFKKLYFVFITSRITDLLSTYYTDNGTLKYETSPLVTKLNFEWSGILFFNFLIIFTLYFIFTLIDFNAINLIEKKFKKRINSLFDYFSYIYYRRKITYIDLFIGRGFDIILFFKTLLPVIVIVIATFSFLASINNILVIKFHKGLLYSLTFNQIYLTLILSMIATIVTVFCLYSYNRFNKLKKND